jgi:hypothetical protein
MKFLIFCPEKPNPDLEKSLKVHAQRLGGSVENISELPIKMEMHELLCICFQAVELQYLEPLRKSNFQYMAFVNSAESEDIPIILRTGGNIFQRSEIIKDSETVTQNLQAYIENMKLKDLAYNLSLKELALIRRIYGHIGADKRKLTQELYGASSETTLDVNLARLRKKIAALKDGKDFFRIITHKRKLYLVSALNDYKHQHLIDAFNRD